MPSRSVKSLALRWLLPSADYPVSRFFRVLFSVFVSLIAATSVTSFLWTDIDGHYTHRLAGLLLLPAFLWPFTLGFIAVISGIFYWLDRRAREKGALNRRQSVLLVLFLSIAALSGYLHGIAGFLALFFLFYWLMTGRVAGRQGWSIANFRATKWDEKLYLGVVIVLFAPIVLEPSLTMLVSGRTVNLGEPPFRLRHENHMEASFERALYKFPDTQTCLEDGARAEHHQDLLRMDWDKISNSHEAQVCMFRLLHTWGGIADAQIWLESQGFNVEKFSGSGFDHDGTLRMDGSWSIRENGPRFPTSGLLKRILPAVPHKMNINATFTRNGRELLYIDIGFITL